MLYSLTSHSLTISIIPSYQEDLSHPEKEHYVWSYNVRIENQSKEPVQIIGRKWKVVDAAAREETIASPGIIGSAVLQAKPVLKPGEALEHTSEAHLSTSSGMVMGSLQVKFGRKRSVVEVDLPSFSLDMPDMKMRLH